MTDIIKNTSPFVSVVIPTYNRMPLIMEAVTSVINQTFTNWELIVVDDGSDDGTACAIESIFDERINVIQLKHEGHIGRLRNAGAKKAKSKWITFLDSDDIWLPGKLEIQLKTLEKSGKRWCYSNFELMNGTGITIPPKAGYFKALSGNIIREVLTTTAAVFIGALIVESELFRELRGFSVDPHLIYRGDYEFELRLALAAEVIAVPNVLVRVREHAGRITKLLSNPYERSAMPYKLFIAIKPGKELVKIAKTHYRSHLYKAAKINFKRKKYLKAFRQIMLLIF